MMPKKAHRLYQRMQYGIKAKNEKVAALIAKRDKIEKEQHEQASPFPKKRKTLTGENVNEGQPKKKEK